MKFRRVVLPLMVILAFLMPSVVVNAKEGEILPKYYKELVGGMNNDIVCIEDCSISMNHTFSWEKGFIKENLSEVEFQEVFEVETSNIWGRLNDVSEEWNKILLISDLWNVGDEELSEAEDKRLVIMVPYWSDDETAVNHVEDVIWEEILPFWNHSSITVLYLDGYSEVHSNFC